MTVLEHEKTLYVEKSKEVKGVVSGNEWERRGNERGTATSVTLKQAPEEYCPICDFSFQDLDESLD